MSAHITKRHDKRCVDAFILHITLSRSLSLTRVIRKWRSRMLFKSHKQQKHILPWETCPLFLAGSCSLLPVCFCFQGCGSPGANLAVRATWAGLCSEQKRTLISAGNWRRVKCLSIHTVCVTFVAPFFGRRDQAVDKNKAIRTARRHHKPPRTGVLPRQAREAVEDSSGWRMLARR